MVSPGIFDMPIVYYGKHIVYSYEKLILANEDNETANPPFFASLPNRFPSQFYVGLPSSPGSGPLAVVSSSRRQHHNGP